MANIISDLHPKGDSSTTIYPNIVNDNIPDSAVTTAKIADSAVTTAKIADSAVTADKINDSAVTTVKINNAAVTTAKINNGAVTQAKMGYHLYQHNIVARDSDSKTFVTFTILNNSNAAIENDTLILYLYNAGLVSSDRCLSASGKYYSYTDYTVVTDVNFVNSTYDSDETNNPVVGIYTDGSRIGIVCLKMLDSASPAVDTDTFLSFDDIIDTVNLLM